MYESGARLARPLACLTREQSAASKERPHDYVSHVHFEYMLFVALLGVRSTYDLTPKVRIAHCSRLVLDVLGVPDLAIILLQLYCCKG